MTTGTAIMPSVTELTEQVMVRLTPDLRAALEADAKANERNLSQTIRLALRQHFGAGESDGPSGGTAAKAKGGEPPKGRESRSLAATPLPPEPTDCLHPKQALVQLTGGLARCGACGLNRRADGTWPE